MMKSIYWVATFHLVVSLVLIYPRVHHYINWQALAVDTFKGEVK